MPLSLVGVVWVTVNNFCTFRKMFLPQVCTQAAWNNILFSFVTSTKWTYQKYGRPETSFCFMMPYPKWLQSFSMSHNRQKRLLRNSVRIYFWRDINWYLFPDEIPRNTGRKSNQPSLIFVWCVKFFTAYFILLIGSHIYVKLKKCNQLYVLS